jgi:hypothetical protein
MEKLIELAKAGPHTRSRPRSKGVLTGIVKAQRESTV